MESPRAVLPCQVVDWYEPSLARRASLTDDSERAHRTGSLQRQLGTENSEPEGDVQ